MARLKARPGQVNAFVLARITPAERRGVEAAAEAAEVTMSAWIRSLVVAELSRLAVRAQLEATP